jgi:Glycosyltransferase family 87/WD40-like Beta Propeller Repeat
VKKGFSCDKTSRMLSWGRVKHLALVAALVLLAGRLIWLSVVPSWQTIVTDFPNYYVSAWAVRHGEPLTDLYNPIWFDREKRRAGIERPAALFNYFPPMNALIMWPLAYLPPLTAKRAWTVVNVIVLIAVVHWTSKSSALKLPAAMIVALLGGDALGNNFTYGQFYLVLTLLMLFGVLFSKQFPSISGIASAVGVVTKIFPGFLLVYFAVRREYRALIWSGVALIALAVLGFITLGWALHRTYLTEVLGRALRGEIQDPYNVHWNTLQAFIRRALVRDELLNPNPILNVPWLFFFLRPLISLAVVGATLYSISQARRPHALLGYGAVIAMVSLITPSQASYHQFLFYPGIAALAAREESWARRLLPCFLFAMICWNGMGATSLYDSGIAMILAFPRVWLVMILWVMFLLALNPPALKLSPPLVLAALTMIALLGATAIFENRRWVADVSDGATRVPLASPADLEVQPRFVSGRLVTSVLGTEGFSDSWSEMEAASVSPDGKWTAFATNERGNWDIAIRSNQTGEIRYLTSSSANDITPTFAPDGKSVYFASDRHRGYRFTTIYRTSVDAR